MLISWDQVKSETTLSPTSRRQELRALGRRLQRVPLCRGAQLDGGQSAHGYENQLDTAAKMRAGRAARTFSRRWCAPARGGSVGEVAGAEPLRENLFAARSQTGRKWDFYPDELNHNAEYRLHLSLCSEWFIPFGPVPL